MNPSITTRVSIAWASDPPSEPTSTLILSSPTGRFIDIRILLDPSLPYGLGQLEMANAGSSIYTTNSTTGLKRGTWTHEIDSRTDDPIIDTGVIRVLSNGDVLETGEMVDSRDGVHKAYQEIWRSVSLEPGKPWKIIDSKSEGYVGSKAELRVKGLLGGDERVLVLRVGRWIQGIAKGAGAEPVVFRAEMSPESEGDWNVIYQIGDANVAKVLVEVAAND